MCSVLQCDDVPSAAGRITDPGIQKGGRDAGESQVHCHINGL